MKRTSRDNQTSFRRGSGHTDRPWASVWGTPDLPGSPPSGGEEQGGQVGGGGRGRGAGGPRGPRGRRPPGRGRGASGLSLGAAPGPARPGPVARLGSARPGGAPRTRSGSRLGRSGRVGRGDAQLPPSRRLRSESPRATRPAGGTRKERPEALRWGTGSCAA